jgi:N-formylglutamate amidohydrolase
MGTADGKACGPAARATAWGACEASDFTAVLDGRFKGGFITRHYGRPAAGRHVLQIEINRRLYMDEDRIAHNSGFPVLAGHLRDFVAAAAALAAQGLPR